MLNYFENHAKISEGECKKLAVVITYNRAKIVGKWLRAWNNAEHYGYKLAVIHACDKETPNKQEMENILSYNPDFYLPIKNTPLRDFGALAMLHDNMLPLPEWEHIVIFTDDMLPMRRTFLRPFAEKIATSNVGLVAQCYEPKRTNGSGGHIRTVAYALKREVMNMLELPFWRGMHQGCGHQFEWDSDNHVMNQVMSMGYDVELCHSRIEADDYQHWTSFLDWMWDCHLLETWTEYWDVYEEQFNPIQRLENYETRIGTLLSLGELCASTEASGKISVLIPCTSDSPRDLVASSLSALARCSPDKIDRIIIGIGGSNEDANGEKHRFADDLAAAGIPVSTVRTHGDTDEGSVIDQLVSLSRSELYMVLMNGCMVTHKRWEVELDEFRKDGGKMMLCSSVNPTAASGSSLVLPHPQHSFAVCKKKPLADKGASWRSFALPMDFYIGNFVSYSKFVKHMSSRGLLGPGFPEDTKFDRLEAPIGTMVLDKATHAQSGVSIISESMVSAKGSGDYEESLEKLAVPLRNSPKLSALLSRYL